MVRGFLLLKTVIFHHELLGCHGAGWKHHRAGIWGRRFWDPKMLDLQQMDVFQNYVDKKMTTIEVGNLLTSFLFGPSFLLAFAWCQLMELSHLGDLSRRHRRHLEIAT